MNKNLLSQHAFSLLITVLLAGGLFSCSSQNVSQKKVKQPKNVITVNIDETVSADEYLTQAENAEPHQAINLFIAASQRYIEENQLAKALWLSEQTLSLVDNERQKKQLFLIKAQCLLLTNHLELALESLNKIEQVSTLSDALQFRYYQSLAEIQQQRGLNLAAVDARLRSFNLNTNTTEIDVESLWLALNQLSQWEIEQLVLNKPPLMQGWQQLLNFAHRFGYDSNSFKRYLSQWQREFALHPANLLIPQLMNEQITFVQSQQNIAIILPLSGRQKAAGESAQQGILSAYNNAENKKLHFIDSNRVDMTTLHQTFTELDINFVIGPLLKENVDQYLAQTELTLPALLFNSPTKEALKEQHMVLSMNPADEAIQAATTLSQRNFRHPIIFSQKDNVSKRIAETFASQWHKITGSTPETVYVNGGATMQNELKKSLDVSASQARINNIDKRIRQKIKTEARNRRDLDMIYVVGSPNETRLLKPYIDVNISPFASAIPIFASSRSHSDNADKSDSRDLTGLQFTEMPWILPSKQQNQPLKQLIETIWPNRSDSLQRIFAMGYDSLSLIDKFHMFKQYPYIRHYGQTGILKLDNNTVLTRSLLWGRYQKDKVQEVAMAQTE